MTPTPQTATPPADLRLGALSGDRACIKCHFNLSGQTIVREPHYGLLVVRCPECGTPAALQEYPTLGRWAPRLGYLVIALWMFILIASVFAVSGLTALITYGTSYELAEPFKERAYDAAANRAKTQQADVGPPTQNQYYGNEPFDADWWTSLPPSKFFDDCGGWRGAIDWTKLWYWYFVFGIGIPVGMGYAVAIPRRGWWRPLVIITLVITFASFILFATNASASWNRGWGVWQAREIAFAHIAWRLFALTLAACAVALFIGFAIGRPVARGLVRLILPPRCWPPLAFLWRADHRPFPKPPRPPA